MTTDANPTKFKVLIGILTILLIALAVYTYSIYNDGKTNEATLTSQKETIEDELEELIANYDTVIQDNELKDKELLSARDRIEELLVDVKSAKMNEGLIKRYKAEINQLKSERQRLFKRADSLIGVNQLLVAQRDSTNVLLTETYQRVDSISSTNQELSDAIKLGSLIKASNLKAEGVIVRNSGKIVDTRRASRADKIQACFTLAPNELAAVGDRVLFVQVINPQNKVLGDKVTLEFDEGSLTYSTKTKVFYERDALDVCSLVPAMEDDLVDGRYVINVFEAGRLLTTAQLELK